MFFYRLIFSFEFSRETEFEQKGIHAEILRGGL